MHPRRAARAARRVEGVAPPGRAVRGRLARAATAGLAERVEAVEPAEQRGEPEEPPGRPAAPVERPAAQPARAAATGGAGGTGGATGGTGGAKDAAPEAPPPPGAVFDVGSFAKSTATGSQVVPHALGQVPKALILWTVGKTNETLSSGFYYGIGMSDASMSVALGDVQPRRSHDVVESRRIASKAITLVQGGEVTVAEADLASSSSASFTLNWTTNDAQPYVVHYLAIGGPQVSAKIVNWQTPTAPASKSVTGFGFQPEAVLHLYAGAAFVNAPPFSQTNAVLGMGAMDKTGAQWAIQASDASAQNPTVASRAQRNDAAIYMYTDTGTAGVTKDAVFVSMNSSGFTLNFTTANANAAQVYSLALAGLRAGVGTFNKTTAAAPASQSVSSGFAPGAVLLASYNIGPQTAASSEPICSFGLGASDGTDEASSAIYSADAVTTTSVDGLDKTSKVLLKMNTPPLDAEADMASFGPTGFTLELDHRRPGGLADLLFCARRAVTDHSCLVRPRGSSTMRCTG